MKSPESFPSLHKPEDEDIFSLEDIEHEAGIHYRPKFLARGGEHVVYEIPEHPNVVVKADPRIARQGIKWNLSQHRPANELGPELSRTAQEYLSRERARFLALREYFGKDHVPNQRKYIAKVPVTPTILQDMLGDDHGVNIPDLFAVISIQKKVDGLQDRHETLVSGYAEDHAVSANSYDKAYRSLVLDNGEDIDRDTFLAVQPSRALRQILERASEDELLRAQLVDFVSRAIAYSNETGEVLDLAGSDNVAFLTHGDEVWTYQLIDALYPSGNVTIARLEETLREITDDSFTEEKINIVLNGLNYVRTINGVARLLGLDKKIRLTSEGFPLSEKIRKLFLKNVEIDI